MLVDISKFRTLLHACTRKCMKGVKISSFLMQ